MEYLEELYLSYVGWNVDDSYANITLASRSILDFAVPTGATLHVSAQNLPHSFTDYTLSNSGPLRGAISYLYSTCPAVAEPSWQVPLNKLVQCYRQYPLHPPEQSSGRFMFGRMYLPGQQLEAMYIHSPTQRPDRAQQHLVAKWVIDQKMAVPMIMTASWLANSPHWTRELLFSTHENLFGFRFLSRLGQWSEPEGQSRLDAGMEVFYAANKKAPGLSAGMRYFTHSRYSGVPLTLTLVTNPIVGSVSAAYTLKPTPLAALSTRYDFNLWSYLSDLTIGCELWRSQPISLTSAQRDDERQGPISVIKASASLASQSAQLLWEGTLKSFLVSAGIKFSYSDPHFPVRMGVEVVYSS